ncbi:hypothetical protein N7468_006548 [Penicillium chermesinum]|uniref:DUF3835 domain-containing protein n=1 Tax=Penicillium chermesinum TaxID=63820 RepID=A0A9W9NUT5_9EURO|nr:uncharacterized protein N7468_006548 [Penicillium chermesinum]KAJ5225323.1 hypothetical protein N7468_006548 [Penicillium chermesinum]
MGVPTHNLTALEQRRRALEENILQLQKSLYHWRTLEADYDGLRDEVKSLDEDATTDEFLLVSRELGSSQVKEEDMKSILDTKGARRSRDQVVDILGRRIDYVQQNVSIVEKRLRAAEDELYALDAGDHPPVQGGCNFAMKEIFEELDDDGAIISSSVNDPGDQAPQLLDLLKKAGVENIPDIPKARELAAKGTTPRADAEPSHAEEAQPAVNAATSDASPAPPPETKTSSQEEAGEELDLSQPVSLVTDEDRSVPPVTDVEESAEDARLRREMLQYGIDEVGAIVAELELDEEGSEFSVDDEDFEFGTDDEDEDEFGRSHTELTEEYHQQMRELEKRLTGREMLNMGKDVRAIPENVQIQEAEPEVELIEEVPMGDASKRSEKDKKAKKRVAFADELDIAPSSEGPSIEQLPSAEKRTLPPMPEAPPLADAIIERTDRVPESHQNAEAPKKVSRFKSARAAVQAPSGLAASTSSPGFPGPQPVRKQANAVPSAIPPALFPATPSEPKPFLTPIADNSDTPSAPQPPQGKTLADMLVERETARGPVNAPSLMSLMRKFIGKRSQANFTVCEIEKSRTTEAFSMTRSPRVYP